jgi:23S rRNA pseudouridine1911/1915/1917 synthase
VPATISTPITTTNTLSARTEAPPPSEPFETTAPDSAAGERADRFPAGAIGSLSRSRVKALIEAGQATRDGTPFTDPAATVRAGARYRLTVPPPEPATPQAEDIPLTVLFEDRDLLVIDKPAGLVVHPAPGNLQGTLVNAVLAHAGEELSGIGGEARPGIVHRLDKDTSGVMVVAKSDRAHQVLSKQFAERDLERSYVALAWGLPAPLSGRIEGAIGRHPMDRKRMAVVTRGGKQAATLYAVERAWGAACCLVRLKLLTGRTHQIRVHLAEIGHPVVGDPVYLRRTPASARLLPEKARAALLGFPRQALHAETLGFRHPVTGEALEFRAPMPPDMAGLVTLLDGDKE